MKKNVLSIGILFLFAGFSLFTGCKKEDTTAPVVTLIGNASDNATLNTAYSDPGATATDEDGKGNSSDITSSIVVTGTVNKDLAGTYTLTYTATDEAGNVGTATRTVEVKNSSANLEGSYTTTDTNPAITGSYTITVTSSSTVNNKIILANLGKYGSSVTVEGTVSGTALTIASQSITPTLCSTPVTGTIKSADLTGTATNGTVNIGSTITMSIPYYFSTTTVFCGSYTFDAGTASLTKQ